MDLIRTLNSVGKGIFVKYYYIFKDESRAVCIKSITEDFTDKSKSSRTEHAKRIFNEGLQAESLQAIINSCRLDAVTVAKAVKILELESLILKKSNK